MRDISLQLFIAVCAGSSLPASSRLFDCYDGTRKTAISGIAWDGGYGVRLVEISAGNGKTSAEARLGEDLGKYAFRPWSYEFTLKRRGKLALTARATNKIGQTQTKELIQNSAGYYHNLIQTLTLDVT